MPIASSSMESGAKKYLAFLECELKTEDSQSTTGCHHSYTVLRFPPWREWKKKWRFSLAGRSKTTHSPRHIPNCGPFAGLLVHTVHTVASLLLYFRSACYILHKRWATKRSLSLSNMALVRKPQLYGSRDSKYSRSSFAFCCASGNNPSNHDNWRGSRGFWWSSNLEVKITWRERWRGQARSL